MSTNFPGSVDDGTTLPNPGANAPTNNPSLSGGQTNQNDAIKAIEAKVGTGASTPSAGKIFRGTGSGASAWGAADLTTDITGVLPVANGGTGVAVLTVPASAILVGTTDAQDVTNKVLHDTFMGTVFDSQSATFRNVLLDGSVNYLAFQLLEIGAAFNLEVPATSSLEVIPFLANQSFSSAQHDHSNPAGGGLLTPAALPAGSVLQVVATTYNAVATGTTLLPHDDTIPQNTEGDQYMSQTITPYYANSLLIIQVDMMVAISVNSYKGIALFQDSNVNAIAGKFSYVGNWTDPTPMVVTQIMTAGTTAATTFKVRAGGEIAGTLTFNGSLGARYYGAITKSAIIVTEVKQ